MIILDFVFVDLIALLAIFIGLISAVSIVLLYLNR